mmetsp:Transcript_1740/g.2959  ORF Transcript_1740/g.2959 Transcript_1740/m.2959 type:complete len:348 (+) Transcript_1740:719-1762(+)
MSRGCYVRGREVQILFYTVNYTSTTCVDTEVVDTALEVRDVRANLLLEAEGLGEEAHKHPEPRGNLFRERQHKWAQRGEILLQRAACHFHYLLGQSHAALAGFVFRLVDAAEAVLGDVLSTHHVQQLEARAERVRPLVREHHSGPSASKKCILQQKGPLVAVIEVLGEVFSGYHEGCTIGFAGKQILHQLNGNDSSGATHSCEVVGADVRFETEFVDDHGAKRGGGGEEGAVHHQDVDVLGVHFRLLQHLSHHVEDNDARLLSRGLRCALNGFVIQAADDARWPGGGGPAAGLLQHALHEGQRLLREALLSTHDLQQLLRRHLPLLWWFKCCKINEIDGLMTAIGIP